MWGHSCGSRDVKKADILWTILSGIRWLGRRPGKRDQGEAGWEGVRVKTALKILREEPWLLWLSGLSAGLWTKRSLVWFPVRARALVVGQVPSLRHARGNWSMNLSHIDISLPLFLPPFPLSKNKWIKSLKKRFCEKKEGENSICENTWDLTGSAGGTGERKR